MFGQVVIGFPGSGKSTYVAVVGQYLASQGRNVKYINLDPGCDNLLYKCDIDVKDIVCVEEVMKQENLGPNEGLVFAMDFLYTNINWLEIKLKSLPSDSYLMIDFPGQVELYIHHAMITKMLCHLIDPKGLNYKLTSVFLADSHYCYSPEAYISILFTTLSSMLQIPLPRVNILSKSGLLKQKRLPFKISYFTKVNSIEYLLNHIQTKKNPSYKEMYASMLDMLSECPWLGFSLFDFKDEKSMKNVIQIIDNKICYFEKPNVKPINDDTVDLNNSTVEQDNRAADEFVSNFF